MTRTLLNLEPLSRIALTLDMGEVPPTSASDAGASLVCSTDAAVGGRRAPGSSQSRLLQTRALVSTPSTRFPPVCMASPKIGTGACIAPAARVTRSGNP